MWMIKTSASDWVKKGVHIKNTLSKTKETLILITKQKTKLLDGYNFTLAVEAYH